MSGETAETLAVWNDLPHPQSGPVPRVSVRIHRSRLHHVIEDHICRFDEHDRAVEPWDRWLPPAVLSILRSSAAAGEIDRETLDELLKTMRSAAEQCFRLPLAISLFRRDQKTSTMRWPHRWVLLLPPGSLMVLATEGQEQVLLTCYFHDVACRKPSADSRCRATIRKFVRRYCRFQNGAFVLRPQTDVITVIGLEAEEWHSGVEFLSEENWGFDRDGRWKTSRIRLYEVGTSNDRSTFRLGPLLKDVGV